MCPSIGRQKPCQYHFSYSFCSIVNPETRGRGSLTHVQPRAHHTLKGPRPPDDIACPQFFPDESDRRIPSVTRSSVLPVAELRNHAVERLRVCLPHARIFYPNTYDRAISARLDPTSLAHKPPNARAGGSRFSTGSGATTRPIGEIVP